MPYTSFGDMPTLASSSPTASPPFQRRRKSWARKIERCCCNTVTYFPLVFVYGLTSWAVWVEVSVSLAGDHNTFAYLRAAAGTALYLLANISYTIAVFTSPGSPLDPRRDASRASRRRTGGYKGLPTHEPEADATGAIVPQEWNMSNVTAKSSGKPRFCKKCNSVKPDRTHHCSTCGKCVLKMDHHCPWLATCVGLRNYKAFLLFLIYTSLFCWLDFAVSGWWTYQELVDGRQMEEGLTVVNTILLAVLGGIIGLVLSGFTGWHIYLVLTGQTTIESLEKTRYLSPLRKSMGQQFQHGRNYLGQEANSTTDSNGKDDQPLGERLKEIHANALPGVLRPEEGESRTPSRSHTPVSLPGAASASVAQESLQRSYASLEAQRERDRYNNYLDEQDSEKLPNAFDMGWKRNLLHVMGDNPLLWGLPLCNTSGDGWQWEVSPKWTEARERLTREREQRERENAYWGAQPQPSLQPPPQNLRWTAGQGFVDQARNIPHFNAERHSQSPMTHTSGSTTMQMQPLDRRKSDVDGYDTSSEDEGKALPSHRGPMSDDKTTNWNDVPDEFLNLRRGPLARSRSHSRRKGD